MQVLLIEDSAETADYIGTLLREHGWQLDHCADPRQGLLRLGGGDYDCVILDRMMPGLDGLSLLELARGAGVQTPVLMLTAMGGLEDRVQGLDAGADDYLAKPFAGSELMARLRSLVRRRPIVAQTTLLQVGDLQLDRATRRATRAGDLLDLSPLEFKLLDCLMSHRGEVVTRTMLLEKVWGYSFDPKTSLVQTHMSRLRAKVDKPYATEMIQTLRGSGYLLEAP